MRQAFSQVKFWLLCIPAVLMAIMALIQIVFRIIFMTTEDGAPMRKTAIGGIMLCFLSALFGLTLTPWAWIGILVGFGAWLQAFAENLYTSPPEVMG